MAFFYLNAVCIAWAFGMFAGIDMLAAATGRTISEENLEPVMLSFYKYSKDLTGADMMIAEFVLNKFRRTFGKFFEQYDMLLTPTCHYGRLDRIPSQVYNSKYGDVEYLLQGDGPTILVSHGITGGIDQGLGISEGFLGSDYPSINTEVQLETVRSPTLIINAIDDPATLIDGARTLARRMPNSQLMTMETGGHLLLGHEEEIKQQINKFININV